MLDKTQAQQWLSVQCRLIDTAAKGIVFAGEADSGRYEPVAAWPEGYARASITDEVIKTAVTRRQTLFASANSESLTEIMATPLLRDGKVHGAVALEIPRPANNEQRGALVQALHLGSIWLSELSAPSAPPTSLALALDLAAACLSAESFDAAGTRLVTELAARLPCDRVSLVRLQQGTVTVAALSYSAGFSQRQQLVRQLAAAAGEALQQEITVVHPPLPERQARINVAHVELARWQKSGAVCTVPLHHGAELFGALIFETASDAPALDIESVTRFEQLAALFGPLLSLRAGQDRGLAELMRDQLRAKFARLVGPGHLVFKLAASSALLIFALLAVLPGRYQVAADASLEGRIERVVAAPQKGFLQSVSARPGDIVKEGAALAALDDRDLKLEQLKWSAKLEQVSQEYRRALSERDRIGIGVLGAQVAQAESQVALIEKQLGRAQLTAPFDGVVVSGDFTQALGSPVERGQPLFKLAPLDDYRVILRVDEADITDVREGQRGRLTLTATPDEALDIVIERITPVATADARANYFRVEAKLDRPPNYLRPGMQGVAKIDIGTRRMLWVWTRSLVNWMSVKLWSWLP